MGRIELLSPIYKMISGSAVPKHDVLSILNTIINGMIVWAKKEKISDASFIYSLESLRSRTISLLTTNTLA